MRGAISILLFGMLAAFGALLYLQREPDDATAVAATTPAAAAVDAGAPVAKPPAPLPRALRTVALGWEWLAPGVLANEGGKTSAYGTAGLDAGFANAVAMEDVESALAKGGGEPGGADLAIVPLSSYVASYERLRALAPEIVFVIGWSRGREALFGADARALAKLPATGPVKLAAPAGQPETFHALFLLELAGVPASRVELVDRAPLTAAFRTGKQKPPGKLLVTSADTPRLMPIVAIAPHGFVQAHAAQLEAWARGWLAGVARLRTDVPAGGRAIAALTGAPPVVGIIEALGQVEFASLRENAAAAGLSGRGALTLDEIFRAAWRIWRDTGALTTPAPEAAPLDTTVIAALVRTDPTAAAEPPARRTAEGPARPEVLLAVRAPGDKLDPEAFVVRIGYVADVFDRLPLRISVRDDDKTAKLLVQLARDRFGLRGAPLVVGKRPPGSAPGAIEVLSGT